MKYCSLKAEKIDGSYNCYFVDDMIEKPKKEQIWSHYSILGRVLLTPDIFDILEVEYKKFLETANLMKDEFYIPLVVSDAVKAGRATVQVYHNADRWYGITYREDLPEVKEAIGGYIHDGLYEGI